MEKIIEKQPKHKASQVPLNEDLGSHLLVSIQKDKYDVEEFRTNDYRETQLQSQARERETKEL